MRTFHNFTLRKFQFKMQCFANFFQYISKSNKIFHLLSLLNKQYWVFNCENQNIVLNTSAFLLDVGYVHVACIKIICISRSVWPITLYYHYCYVPIIIIFTVIAPLRVHGHNWVNKRIFLYVPLKTKCIYFRIFSGPFSRNHSTRPIVWPYLSSILYSNFQGLSLLHELWGCYFVK